MSLVSQSLHPLKFHKERVYFPAMKVLYLTTRTPLKHHAFPLIFLQTIRHRAVKSQPVELPAGCLNSKDWALCLSGIGVSEGEFLFDDPAVLHFLLQLDCRCILFTYLFFHKVNNSFVVKILASLSQNPTIFSFLFLQFSRQCHHLLK